MLEVSRVLECKQLHVLRRALFDCQFAPDRFAAHFRAHGTLDSHVREHGLERVVRSALATKNY